MLSGSQEHARLTEILETFPRVFCFPKSRINENGGKPRSHWKIPSEQLSSSTLEKDCTICPWKFTEIRPGIFGRMVSAHGLGRAYREAVLRARSSDNNQQIGKVIYGVSAKTESWLDVALAKYSSKCALRSLKRRGLAFLASARRPNSNRSATLFSQIYPWNNDLLLSITPRKV